MLRFNKFVEYSGEHAIGYFDCVGFEFLRYRTRPGEGGGTPLQEANRLIGMCRWMGSHFHVWTDYNGVAFSIDLLEWGRKFPDFGGK